MSIRLIALDPDTDGGDCPAVFVDEATGDLLFQGEEEHDQAVLSEMNAMSRVKPGETIGRLPARMRGGVLKALMEVESGRAGEDPV